MKPSKMDRQGVRTPADIERKYPLGQIGSARDSSAKLLLQIQQLSQTLSSFMVETNAKFESLGVGLGYKVTFLVDGNVYQTIFVTEGNTVDAPTTEPTSESGVFGGWQDAEGNEITFPYTPQGDIELTAIFYTSYAPELYTHFGMSEETYPCVAVAVQEDGKTRVVFSQNPLNNTTNVAYKHFTIERTSGVSGVTDSKTVIEWVKTNIPSTTSMGSANWKTVAGTYFANYEIEETDTVKYYPL